jgi:hypothetical protein
LNRIGAPTHDAYSQHDNGAHHHESIGEMALRRARCRSAGVAAALLQLMEYAF